MIKFDLGNSITLTVTAGETFTPENMAGSRHPGAWDRREWRCEVTEHGETRIVDTVTAHVTSDARDVAETFASFVGAAAEQYQHNGMGAGTPLDGWLFGTAEVGEWCYVNGDAFDALRFDESCEV